MWKLLSSHVAMCNMANILYVKLAPYAEEIIGQYQGGFARGRSTVDQIFITRQIAEKCWEQNVEVYQLFVDFQAAYKLGFLPKY